MQFLERTIEASVTDKTTVEQLKNALMKELNIPTEQQILLYRKFDVYASEQAQVMKSGCLSEYGLYEGKKIYIRGYGV